MRVARLFACGCAVALAACLFPDLGALTGSNTDASLDAPEDADAATFSCDGARFCDDFERATVQGPWDSLVSTNNGVLSIEVDDAGNHYLRASILAGSQTKTPQAYTNKVFTNVETVAYRCRMLVRGSVNDYASLSPSIALDEADGTKASLALSFESNHTDGGSYMVLGLYHTQLEAGPSTDNPLAEPFPQGVWNDVELSADLVNLTVTVTVNGLITHQGSLNAAPSPFAPGTVTIQAGELGVAPSGFVDNDTFEVLVDDVTVDYTP